jgi:S-adenosylmethionine:tRNA ribosyltransferase-isomerase
MKVATMPRWGGDAQRMLVLDPVHDAVFERTIADLPQLLAAGDLVVVNDAATIPASLRVAYDGVALELRLAGPPDGATWPAVLFGPGDWRTDTDARPRPPTVHAGDRLELDDGSAIEIVDVSDRSPRLLGIRFDAALPEAWATVMRVGRPIQYAYVRTPVAPDDVQTRYAARPWAVEMPSAGRPLGTATIVALRRRGVGVVAITHAAGLSATGDAGLDAALPWPERYDVSAAAAELVAQTRRRGGRVVAVGTSVVRALEGNARDHGGVVTAGSGVTALILGPSTPVAVVDGVLSGIHEPGTSHHGLLGAFAPAALLARAHQEAVATGLELHEFGDSSLVLPGAVVAAAQGPRRSAA